MKRRIAIVGMGNMGSALLQGLSASEEFSQAEILVAETKKENHQFFTKNPRATLLEHHSQMNSSDVIVLCVKPQDLGSAAAFLQLDKSLWQPESLVISLLAGMSLDKLNLQTGFCGQWVRAMPNIAAKVGCAATAMSHKGNLDPENIKIAEGIFKSFGEAYWVKEELMNAVTGLSGSGPAYIFMVIEALIDGGVNVGLPRDLAKNLAVQTVLGSAKLVKESGLHPALLKDQVTTPAGTTISACVELEAQGLRSMFVKAVRTATKRSMLLNES